MIFLVMITMILLMMVTSLSCPQLEQDDGRLLRHQDQQGDELYRGGLVFAKLFLILIKKVKKLHQALTDLVLTVQSLERTKTFSFVNDSH